MDDRPESQPVLSEEEVRKVARLARLELSDEQAARCARELTSVLGYIEKLRALDLEGVEPMAHVQDAVNRLDEDEPGQTLAREDFLRLAPQTDGPFLKAPKVLGAGA